MNDVSLIERGFEEFLTTIVFLGSRGNIACTNRSWWAFVDMNDYVGDPDSTGVNYLVVRDAACGTDEITGAVADGIRAVLRGDRGLSTAEYPCHLPVVYRWFAFWVVPIDTPRHGSLAFVSYSDITDRRLMELQINEKSEHFAAPVSVPASELKAQLVSTIASVERLTVVDGDAAATLSKSLSRTNLFVEWSITVAGQPDAFDLGAVEFRPRVAQARAPASSDGADDASLRVIGDGLLSADTHLFDPFLVAVPTNCYERNASFGLSSGVVVGMIADGFYVDDDGPRPSPGELAAATTDSNQLFGVNYDVTHLSTVRRIADLYSWQFDVGDSELGGACLEVRGADWN